MKLFHFKVAAVGPVCNSKLNKRNYIVGVLSELRILQLSADYPDPLDWHKPTAIYNLVSLAESHEQRVYALNRVKMGLGISGLSFEDELGIGHRAVAYAAGSKGILLRRGLKRLTDWIMADLARTSWRPNVIHAHKLTVEGLVAHRVASALEVPYVLSIQGSTDLKIMAAKPYLVGHFRQVLHDAAHVVFYAPWTQSAINKRLGARKEAVDLLPCVTKSERLIAPVVGPPRIVTAFNLRDAVKKNAVGLIRAIGLAAREIPDISLDVIGGGDATQFARLARAADKYAKGRIRFLGAIPNAQIQDRLNAAAGFAMVSFSESYGLVFAEALLSGAPCLIPKGGGIDGYFPDAGFVIRANPNNQQEIAAGLVRLVLDQSAMKNELARFGNKDGLDVLTSGSIGPKYLNILDAASGATTRVGM